MMQSQAIRAGRVTALVLLLLSSATLHAQTPPQYSVELLGDATSATDMNHAGVVVGSTLIAGNMRGWIAAHGQPLTPLPLPPGRISSWTRGINDQGVIVGAVGSSYTPEFSGVAAVWTPNGSGGYTVQELGKLPGHVSSNATALNNVGDLVGWSSDGTYRHPALFFAGGAPQSLASTGVFDPQSINDSRVLIDRSWDGKLLDLNTMQVQSLGVPTGLPTNYGSVMGYTINAPGQVSGVAYLTTSTSCVQQSARYTNGVGWEIFGPCGTASGVADMNDQGDMTMVWTLTPVVQLNGLGTFAIESLIDVPVGHWYVSNYSGWRINNSRQLVGPAHNTTTGEFGLLLLTPETPVGTPLCFGDGSFGACPCANTSPQGTNQGCLHSGGVGSILEALGSDSVAADDLVLRQSQVPPGHTVVFLQGGSSATLPFHDGLRCAGSPLKRIETSSASAAGVCLTTVSIATNGAVLPGMTCVYQAWFRDVGGPCGNGSNISSGVQLTWQ